MVAKCAYSGERCEECDGRCEYESALKTALSKAKRGISLRNRKSLYSLIRCQLVLKFAKW
jgi:hypothetical protein